MPGINRRFMPPSSVSSAEQSNIAMQRAEFYHFISKSKFDPPLSVAEIERIISIIYFFYSRASFYVFDKPRYLNIVRIGRHDGRGKSRLVCLVIVLTYIANVN